MNADGAQRSGDPSAAACPCCLSRARRRPHPAEPAFEEHATVLGCGEGGRARGCVAGLEIVRARSGCTAPVLLLLPRPPRRFAPCQLDTGGCPRLPCGGWPRPCRCFHGHGCDLREVSMAAGQADPRCRPLPRWSSACVRRVSTCRYPLRPRSRCPTAPTSSAARVAQPRTPRVPGPGGCRAGPRLATL